MGNTTESFGRSLDVTQPEEDFSAEIKDLRAETQKNPNNGKEKPMYLSNKVVADRAIYISEKGKKTFEEMYGKTLPQEFNGQKVGKYTKMDIVRINGGLKDINDHNPQQISEKENREIIKKKNDLEGFRDRSEQIIQDIQKFSADAKSKLGKRYALDNTFSAPIDGKIVSVSQRPDTQTYYWESYGKEARVHRLEITIDDPKSGTKVVCDIRVWYQHTGNITNDDYFRYSVKVNDVVTNPEETHNLDNDSDAEKNKPRETLNNILGLAERVIAQCPGIIDRQVKKYSAQIKSDKIIQQGEEGKKIQEKTKAEKEKKAAEARLKEVVGG